MDFGKLQGLVPAVIQDEDTHEVLMVGFMNEEALERTRQTGFATFFSRSRNALWTKGETSGNRLTVRRILIDCDEDTVLLHVRRLGDGTVCHTGARTCFFTELESGSVTVAGSGLKAQGSGRARGPGLETQGAEGGRIEGTRHLMTHDPRRP